MNKKILLILAALPLTTLISGCSKGAAQKVTELEKYVFEVDEYTTLDYDYADKFWAKDNDNWGGGCSACTKILDNGHRVIGRNMDLNISNKAAYVVRTNAGKYRTMGLAYTFRDYSLDYEDVKAKGMTSHFSKILPFMCDDVMNDQGLHIEVNMRHGETYPDGSDMFAVEGTNPGKRRVHMFELPRYIAENCKTIEEVKNYVANDLDIYSKNGYWNYCFIIADANGKATLLEFSGNGPAEMFGYDMKPYTFIDEEDIDEVTWLTTGSGSEERSYSLNCLAQTNFYINEWAYLREDTKSGEGRFLTMQNNINNVHTSDDMYNLMDKISYSHFYEPYAQCKALHFDPRSEQLAEFPGASYHLLMAPSLETKIATMMDEYSAPIRALTRQQKRDDNKYWESTFTEVVDINEKSILVRMFEDKNIKFKLTFEETIRIWDTTKN